MLFSSAPALSIVSPFRTRAMTLSRWADRPSMLRWIMLRDRSGVQICGGWGPMGNSKCPGITPMTV